MAVSRVHLVLFNPDQLQKSPQTSKKSDDKNYYVFEKTWANSNLDLINHIKEKSKGANYLILGHNKPLDKYDENELAPLLALRSYLRTQITSYTTEEVLSDLFTLNDVLQSKDSGESYLTALKKLQDNTNHNPLSPQSLMFVYKGDQKKWESFFSVYAMVQHTAINYPNSDIVVDLRDEDQQVVSFIYEKFSSNKNLLPSNVTLLIPGKELIKGEGIIHDNYRDNIQGLCNYFTSDMKNKILNHDDNQILTHFKTICDENASRKSVQAKNEQSCYKVIDLKNLDDVPKPWVKPDSKEETSAWISSGFKKRSSSALFKEKENNIGKKQIENLDSELAKIENEINSKRSVVDEKKEEIKKIKEIINHQEGDILKLQEKVDQIKQKRVNLMMEQSNKKIKKY